MSSARTGVRRPRTRSAPDTGADAPAEPGPIMKHPSAAVARRNVRMSASARRRTCLAESLEPRTLLAALSIAQENALPGNSDWDVFGAGDSSIQGFATDISVNHGEAVNFKI